jgi:hypothetical protein
LAQLISQRLGPLWVIEDPQLALVKIVGHPAGATPARYRALNEDPVIAGKNAHDLVFVPFGQQLDAHSGNAFPVWFRLRRVRDRAREANEKDAELRESRFLQEAKGLGILDKKPD